MQLLLRDSLPFVDITIAYRGMTTDIPNVLVDTGSASTILASDIVASIQITPSAEDILHTIRGVGGIEVAFTRWVDFLKVDQCSVTGLEIEVGGMDYGFEINGILGMDFMTSAGAIINLRDLRMDFAE